MGLPILALGCRARRIRGAIIPPAPPTDTIEHNLLNLSTASDLAFWHRAESGIELDPLANLVQGTSGGILTLSGSLSQALPLRFEFDVGGAVGTARFRWAPDENGAGWIATNVLTSASPIALGSTGISVAFSGTTFGTDSVFQSAVKKWSPYYSVGAGYDLDNSTVTASPGVRYEAHGINNTRASVYCSPGMLGNQSSLGSFVAGAAKAFHFFSLQELQVLPTGGNTLFPWAWASQSFNNRSLVDQVVTGPSVATILDCWGIQRIDATPTPAQRKDSTENSARLRPDTAPHIHEVEYDGTTMTFRIDGMSVGSMTWTGTVNCDRFCLGGVKAGASSATGFAQARYADIWGYTRALNASEAALARLARA